MLELIQSDILYTGMGMPLRGGAVVVSEGRTVVAAGEANTVRNQYPQAQARRQVAVIAPPAVNAHAHLDMSHYPFEARPYFEWIPQVVLKNLKLRGLGGTQTGAQTVKQSGAALVGDIVWPGDRASMEWLLAESGLQGVAYWEVLDPNPATAAQTFEQLQRDIDHLRGFERPGGLRLGLTPHASYTVSARLHALLALYAMREKLPMQIHVSEHPSEAELFAQGTGPLAESFIRAQQGAHPGLSWKDIFSRAPGPDLTAVGYLQELGVLEAKPTLIHMVAVSDEDIRRVAASGCAVVTCPRSNENLHCGTFRWQDFAAAGVDIALGTDSVASGETLNIYDEVEAARRIHPALDPRLLVRAAVKGGHRALGQYQGGRVPLLRRGEDWSEAYIWPLKAESLRT